MGKQGIYCSAEQIAEGRALYASGWSLRRVGAKMNLCGTTILRWCEDILRPKLGCKRCIPRSAEHCAKISRNRRGKKLSDAHCKSMSKSMKRRGIVPPSQRGAIPWNFRGVTPIHERIRRSAEYIAWRKATFERDNYTCQVCAERGGRLRAHHIKKFSTHPDLRLEPTNGITVCERCDIKRVFHREEKWEPFFHAVLRERNII